MEINIIGDICLYDMMLYFFIYGFLGWITEVVYATLKTGKFVNRGFLNGPICPIYGVGIALSILFLNKLSDKWWLLFIVGATLSSFLELITGFVLDKIFKTKWWDYSKEPFNIGGYVCLRFFFIWGIAILLAFKTVIPLVDKIISFLPLKGGGAIILTVLWSVFIIDLIAVVLQLKNLKIRFKEIKKIASILHKNSDNIGEKISDATINVSEKLKAYLDKIKSSRLGKAFPSIVEKLDEIKNNFKDKNKKE